VIGAILNGRARAAITHSDYHRRKCQIIGVKLAGSTDATGRASSTLKEPFGGAATLRVVST
jgi:hypothetical protein